MNIQELKDNNLILFEVISGSKSFGLDTPSSDTDIKGVFYLPKEQFYGLDYIPQISNESNDIVYYEIGRFVDLLLKNNPNILEILASPKDCILYKHPIMEQLKMEGFLSKLCKDTFAGYAQTQIKKARGLNKKIVNPIEEERKSLLEFCYILNDNSTIPLTTWLEKTNRKQEFCGLSNIPNSRDMYALFYDENNTLKYRGIIKNKLSNEVNLSSIPKEEKVLNYMYCNSDGYSIYCKKYKEYWDWMDKRNEERYNTNQKHGKNYDSKNIMHTIRLLQTAERIFTIGELNIRVSNREELLDIKAGNRDYEEVLQIAESLLKNVEEKCKTSDLPDLPNIKEGIKTLVKIRKELYQ